MPQTNNETDALDRRCFPLIETGNKKDGLRNE